MSVLQDPNLERLLAKLHAESDAQNPAIRDHYDERDRSVGRSPEDQAARTKTFLSNKLYALDRDKAEFCYQLLRGIKARRVVEIGKTQEIIAAPQHPLGASLQQPLVLHPGMISFHFDPHILPLPPGHRFPIGKYGLLRDTGAMPMVRGSHDLGITLWNPDFQSLAETYAMTYHLAPDAESLEKGLRGITGPTLIEVPQAFGRNW